MSEGTTGVMSGTVRAMNHAEEVKDISRWIKPNPNTTVLESKDFYKELKLRGYHYAGIFKSVTEARSDGSVAKIKWTNNWASFMDCMLQVNILAIDSRSLYLPTSIRKITINTQKHLKAIEQLDPENPILDVLMSKELGTVVCGGIEIKGLSCSSVGRRKAPGTEVLESYEFVPFNNDSVEYSPVEAASIIMQIYMENQMQYKVKIVEVDSTEYEDETEMQSETEAATSAKKEKDAEQDQEEEEAEPEKTLIRAFDEATNNIPLVVTELTLLRKKKGDIDRIKVEDGQLKSQTNCSLIIGSNWLGDNEAIDQAHASLAESGFLILREESFIRWNEIEPLTGFNLVSLIRVPDETLIVLQRIHAEVNKTVIKVDSTDLAFKWLEPLKEAVKNGATIVVEQNNNDSGIIGLINCIRREPGGNVVRCVLIDDKSAPEFDLKNDFYNDQMKLDLAINVYRNGQWGTYRFLTLKQDMEEKGRLEHYYANVLRYGDLSSFEWMTGWIKPAKTQNLVNIHYSAINFRDVMMATGRLPLEVHSSSRLEQQCVLGLEYSGVTPDGERIMGMVPCGSLGTICEAIENLTWKVPDSMSLRDAATIPAVYTTVYYSFFFYKPISKGKSILIHAGSGGIGLATAAIDI